MPVSVWAISCAGCEDSSTAPRLSGANSRILRNQSIRVVCHSCIDSGNGSDVTFLQFVASGVGARTGGRVV